MSNPSNEKQYKKVQITTDLEGNRIRIGKKIREYRQAQNLKGSQLARLSDISSSFLSDIEKCKSNPSIERLIEISKKLNVNPGGLLNEAIGISEPGSSWLDNIPFKYDSSGKKTLAYITDNTAVENFSSDVSGIKGPLSLIPSVNINDPVFVEITSLIMDFFSWPTVDKKELLSYLKAKKLLRDSETSGTKRKPDNP